MVSFVFGMTFINNIVSCYINQVSGFRNQVSGNKTCFDLLEVKFN
jgi:hypothetical protein